MIQNAWLADEFEQHRAHLRAVAYRMLGSLTESEDAVQDAWLRLNGTTANDVDNLRAWLTTIVARICLNRLRSRKVRREDSLEVRLPDPIVSRDSALQPEDQAVLADSVGLALLVVLDTLTPAERLAFVLHDVFELPFDDIAPMVDRSPEAARQLASRARRRVKGAPTPDSDLSRQREVVDAFFLAAREGDFDRLMRVLHPDVVLRTDFGPAQPRVPRVVRGPKAVMEQAMVGGRLPGAELLPALVNGAAGVVVTVHGRPFAVMGFVVSGGVIAEIDVIAGPERVSRIAADVLSG